MLNSDLGREFSALTKKAFRAEIDYLINYDVGAMSDWTAAMEKKKRQKKEKQEAAKMALFYLKKADIL